MSTIHIACTIDDNYVQHCGVMLCSLFENNKENLLEVYIIYDQLKEKNQQILTNFIKKNYQYDLQYIKIDITELSNIQLKPKDHVSLATYFRILLPKLVPANLNKLLFLDVDILIRSNLRTLWETNIEKYYLGAAINPNTNHRKIALNIPSNEPYFNAGVLLINLKKWRAHQTSQTLLNFINEYSSPLIFWDQDALNACLWGKWKVLATEWNKIKYYDETIPKIVHFVGTRKPWHLRSKHPYRSEYFYYLKMTPWKYYSPILEYLQRVSTHILKSAL